MAKYVICPICKIKFDREKVPFKQAGRRYLHIKCAELSEKQEVETLSKEEQDKKALMDYINKLLGNSANWARITQQIKQFKEKENYSYTGILKALIFFFEIKKNPVEKANGSIGIVPYVYKDAYNYYYSIWEAQQKNEVKLGKDMKINISQEIITIPIPEAKIKKRKLFNFLDEE